MDSSNNILEQEIQGQGIFVSTFVHALDPKRRLTIPSSWRAQVGEPKSLYVLPHVHDPCLSMVPAAVMIERIKRIKQHSMADRKARQFARVLGSQSDLVSWDAQGRIRIKDALLDTVGLTERVMMVGAFDSIELWNPDTFEQVGGLDRGGLQEAAEYVGL